MPKRNVLTSNIKTTVLENGVVIASEYLPAIRSASMGVYLDTGSRDEVPRTSGLSHLFEHMVFKGTKKHDALTIVKCFESTGGQVNAYTSKEQTCFYAKVVDTEVAASLSMLLEMVLESTFDETELRKEKDVIIEEIKGGEDNPEDYIYDLFSKAYFDKQSLGFAIAGTARTVKGLTRDDLLLHQKRTTQELPLYVLAVGNVNHEELVQITRKAFAKDLGKRARVNRKPNSNLKSNLKLDVTGRLRQPLVRPEGIGQSQHLLEKKPVHQVTAILGGPGYAWNHPNRLALFLMNCIFGDGMSSKLFQSVRESLGLVYTIYSNPEFMINTGVYSIGFATEPKDLPKAMKEINKQIIAIKKDGLTKKEIEFAKASLRGGILLGLESTSTRLSSLSRQTMYGQPGESIDKILQKMDKVTTQDIQLCIQDTFQSKKWASAAIVPTKATVDLAKWIDF